MNKDLLTKTTAKEREQIKAVMDRARNKTKGERGQGVNNDSVQSSNISINKISDAFYFEDYKELERLTGIKVNSQIEFEKVWFNEVKE